MSLIITVTDGQEGSVVLPHPLLLTSNVGVSQVLGFPFQRLSSKKLNVMLHQCPFPAESSAGDRKSIVSDWIRNDGIVWNLKSLFVFVMVESSYLVVLTQNIGASSEMFCLA